MEKKYVPNDVFKFRVSLKSELESVNIPVYVKPFPQPWDKGYKSEYHLSLNEKEQLVENKYFTKERIAELKKEFIKRIEECDNPFSIFCCDVDGDYNVTEEQLFSLD